MFALIVIALLIIGAVIYTREDESDNIIQMKEIQNRERKDIIEITLTEDMLKLYNGGKVSFVAPSYADYCEKGSSYWNKKTKTFPRKMSCVRTMYCIQYDRLIIHTDKNLRMTFNYIIDNFNMVEIGHIDYDYINGKNVGDTVYVGCDDSIDIVGVMQSIEPSIYKFDEIEMVMNSFGYAKYRKKSFVCKIGLLDGEYYYLYNGQPILVERKYFAEFNKC